MLRARKTVMYTEPRIASLTEAQGNCGKTHVIITNGIGAELSEPDYAFPESSNKGFNDHRLADKSFILSNRQCTCKFFEQ